MKSTTIVAKLNGGGTARLALSPNDSFAQVTYTPTVGIHRGLARFRLGGLVPGVTHHVAVEVNGILDLSTTGRFTVPDDRSHTFAFGSCARSRSDHGVFDTIRTLDPAPAFFVHLGDLHYDDIGAAAPRDGESYLPEYRAAYDVVLGPGRQGALWRSLPIAYVWDDHDYGPNDSDSTSPGREDAYRAYREYVPHQPLASGTREGVYQSFVVGRVRYLLTDCRSKRSPKRDADGEGKVVLGAAQEAWFLRELLAAKDAGQAICWANSKPWVAAPSPGADSWAGYATERARLAEFIARHDLAARTFIISGDMHAVAYYDADVETHGDYAAAGGANLHVLQAGPLDERSNHKGGPYTEGPFPPLPDDPEQRRPNARQFGVCTVTDSGGPTVAVAFSARSSTGSEIMRHAFTLAAD